MNTGTSGSVSSISAGGDEVDHGDEDEHGDRDRRRRGRPAAGSARTSSRARRRPTRRRSRPRRSRRRRARPDDRGAAARRARAAASRARRSPPAGRRPRSPTRPRPARRDGDEQREQGGDLVQGRPAEGAGGDGGDQHRLGEHEQRGDDAERGVEREQRPHGARAADEARVERPLNARLGAGLARHELDRRLFVHGAEPGPEDVVRPPLVEQDRAAW